MKSWMMVLRVLQYFRESNLEVSLSQEGVPPSQQKCGTSIEVEMGEAVGLGQASVPQSYCT